MIKKQITPEELVEFLNELIEIDRNGISNLFSSRTIVNNDLAGHPTVQVRQHPKADSSENDVYSLAVLGLINGIFGVDKDGWGCIYRTINEEGQIVKFGIVDDSIKGK